MTIPVTPSIRSRLDGDEFLLRKALLDCMLAVQGPAAFDAAGGALGWTPERIAAAAAGLVAKKLVVQEGGQVKYAYPVSAVASSHKVTLDDGRTLHAMCAIDALGCFFEFGRPLQIESTCHVCGEPIQVTVTGAAEVRSQPPAAFALHVDLSKYDDWASKT